MDFVLWLRIWLAVLAVPVVVGCFPYIVMYFRFNGRPMGEHPFWHENPVGRYLIPMPQGGYSPETWAAIRPMPLLYLLGGIGYILFFGLALAGSIWAHPAGLERSRNRERSGAQRPQNSAHRRVSKIGRATGLGAVAELR